MYNHHPHSTNLQYYPQALIQIILLKQRLIEKQELQSQLEIIKQKLHSKQAKHRRSDKQIQKRYQCPQCEKSYASDVALKLHYKLKHYSQSPIKTVTDKIQISHMDQTQHITDSILSQQKLIIEQN